MSLKERLEVLDLINSVQNANNSFVNISVDDLEVVYKHIVEKDLNHNEIVELLVDLKFV